MTIQNNRNWLLRMLPQPTWTPNQWDTVIFVDQNNKKNKQNALVMTNPIPPNNISDLSEIESLTQKPMLCTIMLGEKILENTDIVNLRPLKKK
jgi:hypothetical protein